MVHKIQKMQKKNKKKNRWTNYHIMLSLWLTRCPNRDFYSILYKWSLLYNCCKYITKEYPNIFFPVFWHSAFFRSSLCISPYTCGEDKDVVECRGKVTFTSFLPETWGRGSLCLIMQKILGLSYHTGHRYHGRASAHSQPFEQFAFLDSDVGSEWIQVLYTEWAKENDSRDKGKQLRLCHTFITKIKKSTWTWK